MSQEIASQMQMHAQQLEHDRDMQAVARLHGLISSGSQGLSLLSGGAAVALLAFVQALVDKPAYLAFKCFALGALACFLVAAFLPAITFFFHFAFLNKPYHESREKKLKVVWWLLGAASVFLFVGGVIVFAGVWRAL